jgi:hypothetical protein
VNVNLALSRLFKLQAFSLPRFILRASPYVAAGDERLLNVLEHVRLQQEQTASELAEAIHVRGGRLPKGTYPMQFAALHDVELRYMLTRLLEEQRRVVAEIDEAAYALRDDDAARELARDVRRKETAHLRLFEELCQSYPVAGARRRGGARQTGSSGVPVAERSSSKTTRRAAAPPEREPGVAASLAS